MINKNNRSSSYKTSIQQQQGKFQQAHSRVKDLGRNEYSMSTVLQNTL